MRKFEDYNGGKIAEYIKEDNSDVISNMQNIKSEIVGSIFENKILDPRKEKDFYKKYLESLEKNILNTDSESKNFSHYKKEILSKINFILSDDKFFQKYKNQFEKFYKKQTKESLEKDFSQLDFAKEILSYNDFFDKNIDLFSKYGFDEIRSLKEKIRSNRISQKEKDKIRKYLKIIDSKEIPNSRSKIVKFDENIFLKDGGISKENIQCFYDEDFEGNLNYFSFNDILNDLQTFGLEVGRLRILEDENFKKYFISADRKIKHALAKNILLEKRNMQEILMFGFKDRGLGEISEKDEKNGFSAEKITEWFFRFFAKKVKDGDFQLKDGDFEKIKNLEITIDSASVGEDEKEKNDLFIKVKDKKTGVSVQKELQLTINSSPDILKKKKIQIEKRKTVEKINGNNLDLELLELQNLNFARALKIWKVSNRPVGGLKNIFSFDDIDYLEVTFIRILEDLLNKI